MDYGWEHGKMLIAALLVFLTSDTFNLILFLIVGFSFANAAIREVDGSVIRFAIDATLASMSVFGVYLVLEKVLRRR
jgi:hypothetical protein